MEYKINTEDKTITIIGSAGKVDEIKSLMTLQVNQRRNVSVTHPKGVMVIVNAKKSNLKS